MKRGISGAGVILESIAIYPRTPLSAQFTSVPLGDSTPGPATGTLKTPYTPRLATSQYLVPRTPHTSRRPPQDYVDEDEESNGDEDALLGTARRRSEALLDEARLLDEKAPVGLSWADKRGMMLLTLLYTIQGLPLGLATGSIPFLLREHLSYAQIGTFALCAYPYSAKLLWSPIIDACFSRRIGRRKTWVVPLQAIIGALFLYLSMHIEACLTNPAAKLTMMTVTFTSLVLCASSQDVAVDGWALTLLSERNVAYASLCQTTGLNTGYYLSFPILLALSSPTFSARWGIPILSLTWYLRGWAIVCFCTAFTLLLLNKEPSVSKRDIPSVPGVYRTIWRILCMPHIQTLMIIHTLAKLSFAANESVTALKLMDAGLAREDLSLLSVLDFPFQLIGGAIAARWSTPKHPLRPWVWAFAPRMMFVGVMSGVVRFFPHAADGSKAIDGWFYVFLVVVWILQSFTGTVQFAGMAAFHARISDPAIGGTYMTLLITFSNLGHTWPRWFVLRGVDYFTEAMCAVPDSSLTVLHRATECVSDTGKATCSALGGTCVVSQDGYYVVQAICFVLGLATVVVYIIPQVRKLQELPQEDWRLPKDETF